MHETDDRRPRYKPAGSDRCRLDRRNNRARRTPLHRKRIAERLGGQNPGRPGEHRHHLEDLSLLG